MNSLLQFKNVIGLPDEVVSVIERSITVEYASLTKSARPITYPVTPYVHPDGKTISISTGLTYPTKAERARNNPAVCLLFSDATGTNLENPPVVQIFGHAVVRDSNLQENTDRYIQLSATKLPSSTSTPAWMRRRMRFYFVRIWIEILPLRVLWWQHGDITSEPQEWQIDPSIELPESDPKPAPLVHKYRSYINPPDDWRVDLQTSVREMGKPVLTTVIDGYPVPVRVLDARLDDDNVILTIPSSQKVNEGYACLTFHEHDAAFSFQQNRLFKGTLKQEGETSIFVVDGQIGNWSLKGHPMKVLFDFFMKGRRLNERLKIEAERRGQAVPDIHL